MTPASRLRSLLARVLGERRMLAVARWACPSCCDVHYRAACDAVVHAYRSSSDLLALRAGEQYHKRRALARRRWGRRAERREDAADINETMRRWWLEDWNPNVDGQTYEVKISFVPPTDPICQEPGQYPPSGAADLGYVNKSKSTKHKEG